MDNESFNIDDILSEVRKRREENEFRIKGEQLGVQEKKDEQYEFKINSEKEESILTEQPDESEENASDESFELMGNENEEEAGSDGIEQETEETEESEEHEEYEETEQPIESDDSVVDEQNESDDGMVDLFALASQEKELEAINIQPEDTKKKMNKKLKVVITVLVLLIIGAVIIGALYINNMLNKVTDSPEATDYEMVTYYEGMDFLQEDFPVIEEMSAYELQGYKDYLKKWYKTGDPVSSTHILNVLLIGEDTREESISDTSRADSAIIASINVDTGEIHLTSILRDLYVYYEIDGQEHYGKINESASNGGMKCYINTLERYYKISINNYAVVNFASFPKIIDALNGVTIKITSKEIYEINSHPKRYGGVTITQSFEGTEGTMKLNGQQALAYCRIRKIDSDGARANRQKTVLTAILKKMKKSGKIDTVKVVNQLAGYVYTGYSKKDLISLGNKALSDGWLDYEIKSRNVPRVENCKGGQNFSAAPNNWIWLADIPKDAYELQMEIYGKSNIKLNESRADYIALGR